MARPCPKQTLFIVELHEKPEQGRVGQKESQRKLQNALERARGFEPLTTCLGSKYSTTELRPLSVYLQAVTV